MTRLAFAFALVASVTGCKKVKDMAKYQDRAKALAAKFGPKVAELSKNLPDLAAHAKDLPVNVPGADKLAKLITDNQSELKSAQDLLASLPQKLSSDTPEQADKDLAEAEKSLSSEVAAAEDDEKQEAAIESAAKAGQGSAAPAAGSGAPVAK